MPISFSNIPQGWKVPLFWAEVDPSMAGLPLLRQPALLVGTMNTTTGDATPDVPTPIGTQAQADARYGRGSELANMFKSYFANNFANECWGVGVAPPTGAPATAVINITQPATEGGTVHLYVGAEHVGTNIGASDTTTAIATAIAGEINKNGSLPVTAVGAAPVAPVGQAITAATWAANQATFTTQNPHGIAVGETVTVGAVDPPEYDGTFVAVTGTTGSTVIVDMAVDPGTYVSAGTLTGSAVTANATVTLTAKWVGVSANDIRISLNYYGRIGGEVLPPGLTLGLPATGFLTGGTGVPIFTTAADNLGEAVFEYVAMPYTDATSLGVWETEYGFSDSGRWGWRRQLYGHVLSARRGTYADLLLFGDTRNSPVISVMGFERTSPSPAYEWAAAYTAKAQRALTNDPARPLQTLSLNKIKAAPLHERFELDEINGLAGHGLATQIIGADSQPMISRETTMYQLNLYGFTDDAYELMTTLSTLARLLRNQRQAITSKFPRHKLANDGTRFGPGQAIVTPGIIKAELIAQYRMDEFNGLVEDTRAFKRHLLVERDPNDQNRVNVLYPPDLVNQMRLYAVLAQFRLQYDRGVDQEIVGAANVTGLAA